MSGFKRQELVHFITDGSKASPPVFAGREMILDEILTTSVRAFERGSAPAGNTIVIQGAPGAGKTSILKEIENQSQKAGMQPRPLIVSPADIKNNRTEVLKAIAVIASKPQADWLTMIKRTGANVARRTGSVSFLSLSIDFANMVRADAPHTLYDLQQMLPAEKWVNPVILAIDEAQRFSEYTTNDHAELLHYIHDAQQIHLPLTLVFAGLGDTENHVNAMGITNGVFAHTIGALTLRESTEVIDGFCTHFGINVSTAQHEPLHDFFISTEGWPRHIYWAQKSLAEVLIHPDIHGDLSKIADWSAAEQRRDQYRLGYYNNRNSTAMKRAPKLVGAVQQAIMTYADNGLMLDFAQIGDLIDHFIRSDDGKNRAWRTPDIFGTDQSVVDRFIEHLIHQGALAHDPNTQSYQCPIPSFQSYLIHHARFTSDEKQQLQEKLAADIAALKGHNGRKPSER
ncbi:MAG: ATP-binding protein [Aestuariivita sp.]|nr:ATP-binding protein [Aestuariivita sp.]